MFSEWDEDTLTALKLVEFSLTEVEGTTLHDKSLCDWRTRKAIDECEKGSSHSC